MSILFPVTGNGVSQSETNLQLRDVLARHHLQYGFHVVNFIICPTVKEALEAPIEEWKREFAEFAEWSWDIKDSVGTLGLWRGHVVEFEPRAMGVPTVATLGGIAGVIVGAIVAAPAATAVVGPLVAAAISGAVFGWRWISRRDQP